MRSVPCLRLWTYSGTWRDGRGPGPARTWRPCRYAWASRQDVPPLGKVRPYTRRAQWLLATPSRGLWRCKPVPCREPFSVVWRLRTWCSGWYASRACRWWLSRGRRPLEESIRYWGGAYGARLSRHIPHELGRLLSAVHGSWPRCAPYGRT